MARTVFTLLALLLILAGCSYGEAAASGRDPYSILAGQWGWQGTDDCAAFPKKIHFSPNHDYMYLSLAPRKNDGTRKPRHEYRYKVLGEGQNVLHLSLDGEWRHDTSGAPVTWYLVIVNHDEIFWNRSDWPHDRGTKPIVRCKPNTSFKPIAKPLRGSPAA